VRAVVFTEFGGPEVLRAEEVPTPEPGPGEALLAVKACGLNHLDLWVRRGPATTPIPMPHILGADVAGTVAKVGSGIQGLPVGLPVTVNPSLWCGVCEYCRMGEESLCMKFGLLGDDRNGGYAELCVVPVQNLMPIPPGFSFEEVAAVPLVFLTAWRMLVTKAQVRAGDDVLVIGAGGGVSSAAIQIAKLHGARVFATSGSSSKLQKAKALGADILINHKQEAFDEVVRGQTNGRGVDIVVENVGEATFAKSLASLRKGGKLVTCGRTSGSRAELDISDIYWRQIEILGSTMGNVREFETVMRLIWRRQLKPVVDRVLPLHEARRAHEILEHQRQFGKVILVP